MELTSRLCRAQETAQLERAAGTSLENVRIIAERAASAWRQAAIDAEHREARRARARAIAELMSVQKQQSSQDDLMFSENPDRGLAQV